MQLEDIVALYRHVPFFPKRSLYRHIVNWTEGKRAGQENQKTTTIRLDNNRCFKMNVDINTWLGKEIFYFGKFELFAYRFFLKNVQQNAVIVDVGANIGFYSLLSSVLVGERGQIHSFEPTDKFFSQLDQNVKLNPFTNIHLNKFALGEENKQLFIEVREQTASVTEDESGERVDQLTLDQYFSNLNEKPDLIKIDVDGHELPILRGSAQVIENCLPKICLEVSRHQQDCEQIFDYLASYGYRIFNENNPTVTIEFSDAKELFKHINGFNLIAIHKDSNYELW